LHNAVCDVMRKWLRQQGRDLPLDAKDLKAQMKVRPYWILEPNGGLKQRFSGRNSETCWGIDVDKMPELGFNPVSDEVFTEKVIASTNESFDDPRKGDLFSLIDLLLPKPATGP